MAQASHCGFNPQDYQSICQDAWKLYPHIFAKRASKGKWVPYKHLRYISSVIGPKILEGNGRFILTTGPRHGKSQLVSNWLPTWFLHNFPHKSVILSSYSLELAAKWGAQVKENLTSIPEIAIELKADTKSKRNFLTAQGGGMICAGVGGAVTGQGGHLVINDDYLKNYQEAMSELIRERHIDWYRSVIRTRLEPKASIVIMATRWHEADLIGWLISEDIERLKEDPNHIPFTVINFPTICEEEGDFLGRKIGEPLCPERFDLPALLSIKKDVGDLVWSALYQQRPTSLEGNIILKEWIRYYDILPKSFDEEIITADLSFKEGTTTDFTVVQKWSRKGSDMFLIDQIRGRMGFPDQIAAIRLMNQRHPNAFLKIIEEAANGAAVIEMLKHEIMGLVPVKPQTSKEARLAAISPMFEAGNVHFPNPKHSEWSKGVVSEILSCPNGKHDDQMDAAVYAITHMSKVSSSVQRLESLGRW